MRNQKGVGGGSASGLGWGLATGLSWVLGALAVGMAAEVERGPWNWTEDAVPDLGFDLDEAQVIRVTTTKLDGKGSLMEALRAEGPRIVVFDVSGVIDLNRRTLLVRNPQLVVAGQTAPEGGITLIRGGLSVDASQVLIQHLAIRPGDAGEAKRSGFTPDGFATTGNVRDVWVDHCSLTWSVDENGSASSYKAPEGDGARRIFFRDCIIAEALNDSSHDKGPHSKGTLVMDGTHEVAVVRCLYAANVERNPLFKADTSGVVVNCLMSSVGQRSIHATLPEAGSNVPRAQVAVVGTEVRFGPDTKKSSAVVEGGADWYLAGNEGRNLEGEAIPQIRNGEALLEAAPVWPEGLEAMPVAEVAGWIERQAGARPGERDAIDARIVSGALAGTLRIIDSQEEVGGYPVVEERRRVLEVPDTGRREWLAEWDEKVGFKD